MKKKPVTYCLLTIAGTDPSGAAGIQADLQVFRDLGYHGLSVVTAVVWQNTVGVRGWQSMGPEALSAQLETIAEDVPIAGIKLGMLPDVASVEVVSAFISRLRSSATATNRGAIPVVLDPILASGDGRYPLSKQETMHRAVELLYAQTDVLTPNVPEAEQLLGSTIRTADEMLQAAERLQKLGPRAVLLKGGHLSEQPEFELTDAFADRDGARLLPALPAIDEDVRGTGCQLASAILCGLAGDCLEGQRGGLTAVEAVEQARRYLNDLLHASNRVRIGRGRSILVRPMRAGFLPNVTS